jgi:G:T/U-mismatch repair DNA glycosylase
MMSEQSLYPIERHPLQPFLPENARVLFLGSFPPQKKRWCMEFYYPNFINDHWRIEGEVFFGDRNHFVIEDEELDASKRQKARRFDREAIVAFCREKGIAFYDTATAVRRLKDNASDEFLEVVEPTDIRALLTQLPHCKAIVTTGQKATDTLCRYFGIENAPKAASEREKSQACLDSSEPMEQRELSSLLGWPSRDRGRRSQREQARSKIKLGESIAIPNVRNRDGNDILLYRLPSSSRAYPLAFDKKVAAYRTMFEAVGLTTPHED